MSRNRRKSLVVLMVLTLLVSILAACSSNNQNTSQPSASSSGAPASGSSTESAATDTSTLEGWGAAIKAKFNGTTLNLAFPTHPSTDAFQKLTADFEALTGIKVTWEVMEETYLKNKQLLDFTGKTGTYDVIGVDGFWLTEYGAKKVVAPLETFLNDPNQTPAWFDYNDIVDAYRNGNSRYNNIPYGIPTAMETRYVAYRKDLFDKYGKQPPKTMDEMLTLAKFFNGKEKGLYGIAMRAQRGIHNASGIMTIMYNFGGGFLDQKTGAITMTDPKTIQAMQYYVDLLHNAPPDVGSYTHEEAISAFMSGKTAMWLDSTAISQQITDPSKSTVYDKVGFVPTPEGPAGRAAALAGWNMSISENSKNKEAAWAFIVYMGSKLKAKDYINAGGTPVRTSVYQDPELVAKNPSYPAQLAALADANALVERGISWIPKDPNLGQMLDRVGYYGSMALAGDITVQEAAQKAQKELEDIKAGKSK